VSGPLSRRLDGPEDAPVLVLSNSLGTSLEMWDGMLPALAGRFRVLRYDQRGSGSTPAVPGPYAIADLGRDVLGLLDELGLERVAFAGCSLGGMTGMWLAINAPERVGRLALCNTSAHMPPRANWIERAATVRERGMEAVVDATLERWFSPAAPAAGVAASRAMVLATDPEGYAACCEAIAEHDLRAEIGAIKAPTLIVAATEDPSTPPDHSRVLEAGIDGSRLVVLDGLRHLACVERPDDVGGELLVHLTAEVTA
jgi:3-oxoadipate enol-lactonase